MSSIRVIPKGKKVEVSDPKCVLHEHILKEDYVVDPSCVVSNLFDPQEGQDLEFRMQIRADAEWATYSFEKLTKMRFEVVRTNNEMWPFLIFHLESVEHRLVPTP